MAEPIHFIVAALALLVASTVVSTLGFGIGLTATPILLLVLEPQTVVVMLNTVGITVFVLILAQTRRHLPVREMAPIGIAGLLGVPVGVYVLSTTSASVMRIVITILVLVLAALAVSGVGSSIDRPRLLGPPLGFVVAALITSSGIGGPLMVLYLLHPARPVPALRASLSFFFLLIMFAGVAGYGVAGLYTVDRLVLIGAMFVPVLVGVRMSALILRRLSQTTFRSGALAVMIATSAAVLARELLQL